MEWTDQEAAERARGGDQSAFRVLVERHSHALFRLAFRMTGNEQDAEDLVQETLLRAYKQLHKFDGRAAFATWLYRICMNCCLDWIRSRKLRREQQALDYGAEEKGQWLEQVPGFEPSPERIWASREIADLLQPAMARLTEIERSAFLLRHYEGFNLEQIADVLGVKTGAAKHSIFRAVQKLRRALRPLWQVETR